MKNLYLLLILFSILFRGTLSAQELKLKSFAHKKFEPTAKIANVRDNNDNPCALVRIYVALTEVEFKASSGIKQGPTSDRPSEYKLFLPAGSKSITVYGNGYLPFTYTFEEEILGHHTYELYLEVPIITDYAQILEQQAKMLQNQHAASSSTPAVQEKRWKVGDYYNENGKEGVVFWVDESGEHGKIVSIKHGRDLNWEEANQWCKHLGINWKLPTRFELKLLYQYRDVIDKTSFNHKGQWAIINNLYWSSEKSSNYNGRNVFHMGEGHSNLALSEEYTAHVRAVSAF